MVVSSAAPTTGGGGRVNLPVQVGPGAVGEVDVNNPLVGGGGHPKRPLPLGEGVPATRVSLFQHPNNVRTVFVGVGP